MSREWEMQVHFQASAQVYDAMFGAGSTLAAEARRVAREVGYGSFFDLMFPAGGLREVLTELRVSYRLAMATNRGSTVPEILRRFGLDAFVEFAVGIHDVERPKPYPDMLLRCLEYFRVPATAAVYVGDAETDYEAAVAAGVHFIRVGSTPSARWRVATLRDLPQELLRLTAELGNDPKPLDR